MDKEIIEVLLKEYEIRSDELAQQEKRYHQQTRFTYLYFSVVIGVISALSMKEELQKLLTNPQIPAARLEVLYFLLLFLAALIGFYLFASTVDALCMVYLLGKRRGKIEDLINTEANNKNLLAWDNKDLPGFLSLKWKRIKTWIKPPVMVAIWIFLFVIVTNILLCFTCFLIARKYATLYSIFIGLATCFNLYQWLALHGIGVPYIRSDLLTKKP